MELITRITSLFIKRNRRSSSGETQEQQQNGQMEEEDEELGGCKGEPEWPVDRLGGREGGGIPGVTLRQGAEAESLPPLHFQEIVAPYVT